MFCRVGVALIILAVSGAFLGCQTARIGHTGIKVPVPSLSFIGLPWPGLGEGDLAGMAWENAFVAMKGRMQHEYPFTEWKGVDWDALEAKFGAPASAKLEWRPSTSVSLDEDTARSVMKLVDVLEDNDDVQNVYANFEVSEDVLAKLST